MPRVRSLCSATDPGSTGRKKLGQPVPLSNLVSLPNSAWPQPAQRYTPSSWWSQYAPVKARSVPFWRSTRYSSGDRAAFHSASVFMVEGCWAGAVVG